MSLEVTRKPIPDILNLLRKGEWQIPMFQREFIWSKAQVYALLYSIVVSRPMGLITLWAQPQGDPLTPSEPIKIPGAEYRKFAQDPAVMKLVLDGRQRLTAITMAFGGLHSPDDRFLYGGKWFLNLDEEIDSEKIIEFKKQKQIKSANLTSMPNCLAKALIPLEDYSQFGEYNQNIHYKKFYPADEFPDDEVRARRSQRLSKFYETFMNFEIPIAEIPETVTLPQVCDIFDVLNTTGTKVSTFDIIHNLLYAETKGAFELRKVFASCQESTSGFGLLCDPSRQDFFCQTVTGCYISGPSPKPRKPRRSNAPLDSLKGGDLMDTPTAFYQTFKDNLPKVDTYCSNLFSEVLDGDFRLKDIPYPVSVILYISLRWYAEIYLTDGRYTTDQLNKVFRAFFWRNALTGRYDQGFLTRFTTDQVRLKSILIDAQKKRQKDWTAFCNQRLNELFGEQDPPLTKDRIVQLLKEGEIRGALRQAFSLFLYSKARTDWVEGLPLNRFSDEKGRLVQLHHIFPQQWCKDNKGSQAVLKDNDSILDCFANLVPLTSK
ncbi:MAG TPA: DUF262 domain-containing protein, partial [Pyrinomonadaceae bacterium]|nr:DUF262 domain-containing protein [Pyrinomonadaceae bacterium]